MKVTILAVATTIDVMLVTLAVYLHPLATEGLVGFGVSMLSLVLILVLSWNFRGHQDSDQF